MNCSTRFAASVAVAAVTLLMSTTCPATEPGDAAATIVRGGGRLFQISYILPGSGEGEPEDVVIPIRLQTTRPHLGGVRWWFICPLISDRIACERGVAKLHLPPGGRHIGCRTCHDLTYRSCQQAHQAERLLGDAWYQRQKARLDRLNARLDRRLGRPARTRVRSGPILPILRKRE